MKRFCWVLIVAAISCSPDPPKPQPRKKKPVAEETEEKPFQLRITKHARIHLRSSELPPELGETGFALDLGVHKAEVITRSPGEISLAWQMKERFQVERDRYDEAVLSGSVRSRSWNRTRSLLLPALWEAKPEQDGVALLWLSSEAYSELKDSGQTTWRIAHVGSEEGTLKRIERTVRPLTVNGVPRTVPVLRAESALAEFVIHDHAEEPLILEVKFRKGMGPAERPVTSTKRTRLTLDYRVLEVWILE